MTVKITSTMTDYIAWLQSEPMIVDVAVSEVDPSYVEMMPASVTNPVLFTLSLSNPSNGSTGTAHMIIPDVYYNGYDWEGLQPPIDQFWALTKWDNPDLFGLTMPYVVAYVNPAINKVHPLFGFSDQPIDLNNANPQLQVLAEKISTVTNTVVFYQYLSSQVLTHLGTDEAYYGYCYFGTAPFTTFLGGQDAIGIAITKTDYLSTATHQYIVDFVANRIKEYKGL